MFIGEEGVDGEFGGQQRIIKENRQEKLTHAREYPFCLSPLARAEEEKGKGMIVKMTGGFLKDKSEINRFF